MTDEEKGYFRWLCYRIGIEDYPGRRHYLLANDLWNIEWVSLLPMDRNRETDALDLRKNYQSNNDCDPEAMAKLGPVRALEMMVCLAGRIAEMLSDSDIEDNNENRWFFEMAGNAGLCVMDDDSYIAKEGLFITHEAMMRVIGRTYCENGLGGFFPLAYAKNDQRKCELWYQMNQYVIENYAQI